jgi:uncharacterized RDD family membrane protein YckC
MSTGFGKIYYNRKLQDYWIRRLLAFIIDAALIGIATSIITSIIFLAVAISTNAPYAMPWWSMHVLTFPFFSGIPFFLYSALTENAYGLTLGKRVMSLKVVATSGKKPLVNIAFLRNVTKIYFLAILLDVVIPLAMPNRDPTRKYTDIVAGTSVVDAGYTASQIERS